MKRLAFLIAFSGLLLFSSASSAEACSCAFGGGAPCQEYWRVDAVFSGTIIGSSSIESNDGPFKTSERRLRVAIKQAFRGIPGGQTEVVTGWGGGDCGYEFELGQSYLIYAHRDQRDRKLHTSICTRTRPISESADDIAFINALSTAEAGAMIFGQVAKRKYQWKEGESWLTPVADAEVTIEGQGDKRGLRSDQDGNYRLTGFAPGTYKVLLKLPPGLLRNSYLKDEGARVVEDEVTVVERGCAQANFYLESDTRVTGRVLSASGQPISNLRLDMRGADADNNNINVFLTAKTNQEGSFEFKLVPPGDYRFGFRIIDSPSTIEVPYPRTYYPGVTTRAAAQIIKVKEGEGLQNLELLMPNSRQQYQVEGQVVWSDGKPAPGVNIYLSLTEEADTTGSSTLRADSQGQFKLKVYDGLQYQVSAYPQNATGPAAQSPWITVPSLHGPGKVKIILPGVPHP